MICSRPHVQRHTLRSESGSIIILTALSMVVLLGIVALAVDASFMYTERNRMASAADAAAKSAAFENHRNPSSDLQAYANREVVQHGFNPDPAGTTVVTVNRPPLNGPYTSNPGYVEVFVSRPTASFFAPVLNAAWASLTPMTRAVAGVSAGPNCIVTLPPNEGSTSFELGSTGTINMPNCGIEVSGNMYIQGGNGPGITASGVGVEGTCSGNCPSYSSIPTPADPLASLVPPDPNDYGYGTPVPFVLGNNQPPVTLNPGAYSYITIGNSDIVTLNPGLYYITEQVNINNSASVTGNGVTLFFAGIHGGQDPCPGPPGALAGAGCLNVGNNATMTLSAPTSGPYNGILFYQDRANHYDATFANTSIFNFSGAMYFPSADVTLGNSGGSNDCTLFVAHHIDMAGSGSGNMVFSNLCAAYGGSPLLTVSLAE